MHGFGTGRRAGHRALRGAPPVDLHRAGRFALSVDYTIVIPSIGRPSLGALLESIAASIGPPPGQIIVVDDSADGSIGDQTRPGLPVTVLTHRPGHRGPAAARNTGWRASASPWVVFLDDDVEVGPAWAADLAVDLATALPAVAGIEGRITVPLPSGRQPTDWERNVAGLAEACWATADLAYRRDVLEEVGGFDERFRRAFREDADIGLRITDAGYVIGRGRRQVRHPVRPAGPMVSLRMQAGNADDILMRHLHGPDWRARAHAELGRTGRHALAAGAATAAALGVCTGRRTLALSGLAAWSAATSEFAWQRIKPGPRTPAEVATMVATSAAIPLAATAQSLRGWARVARLPDHGPSAGLEFRYPDSWQARRFGGVPRVIKTDRKWRPLAVLFDRDGTLIADTGYPRDPERVSLMPGARMAVQRVRRARLATAVVSNQSGVGRGLITHDEMESVNRRVERLVGPFDLWSICCHAPDEGCACRKPRPGLVTRAARQLGIEPRNCVVIGDIGADMQAAEAAGARSILVPTGRTRRPEIRAARQVAPNLLTAVDLALAGSC